MSVAESAEELTREGRLADVNRHVGPSASVGTASAGSAAVLHGGAPDVSVGEGRPGVQGRLPSRPGIESWKAKESL